MGGAACGPLSSPAMVIYGTPARLGANALCSAGYDCYTCPATAPSPRIVFSLARPPAMALRFAGKHCAVVGGTGIIGSHIAKAFAANGAVVSVLGRSAVDMRPALESQLQPYKPPTEATLSTKSPNSHQFIRLDVSDAANIKSVFSSRPSSVSLVYAPDAPSPHTKR